MLFRSSNIYKIGDYNNDVNGSSFIIDDGNEEIYTNLLGDGITFRYGLRLYVPPRYERPSPVTQIGDFNDVFGGGYLEVNNGVADNYYIKTFSGNNQLGLSLDFGSNVYSLGDYAGVVSGTSINVDVQNSLIYTYLGGTNAGLYFDSNTGFYQYGVNLGIANQVFGLEINLSQVYIGDVGGIYANRYINIDNTNEYILTSSFGLFIDYGSRNCILGDYDGAGNNTFLQINDVDGRWYMSGNLSAGGASGSSGNYLTVWVGGVEYRIDLLNP